MSKHHQSKKEQRSNNRHKGPQSGQKDDLYSVMPEEQAIATHHPVQRQAYEPYYLKEGPALDDRFEAERILKNHGGFVSVTGY